MKVFVIGAAACDKILHVDEFFEAKAQNIYPKSINYSLGSTGIGKVIPLKKLGLEVSFHAMIGEDSCGIDIKKRMSEEDIDFIYDIDPKGSLKHINIMNDHGDRISIYENYQTFEPECDELQVTAKIKEADLVVLNIVNYTRKFIPLIKALNKKIFVDLHDYDGTNPYHEDFIECADIIQLSMENMKYTKLFVEAMLTKGKEVITTNGHHGSYLYVNDKIYHQPIIVAKEVLDTNGAGDHFSTGYIFGEINQLKPEDKLKAAAIVATACVESMDISNDEINESWLREKLNL